MTNAQARLLALPLVMIAGSRCIPRSKFSLFIGGLVSRASIVFIEMKQSPAKSLKGRYSASLWLSVSLW